MTKFPVKTAFTAFCLGTISLALTFPAIAQAQSFTVATGANQSLLIDGNPYNNQIRGAAGGQKNSGTCGWIESSPNHTFSVNSGGLVSMKIEVASPSVPQPYTLMIRNTSDPGAVPFCAIADPDSGIAAVIGGVWHASSTYEIFVGNFDTSGSKLPYILRITK
jgi:hypothetical protein